MTEIIKQWIADRAENSFMFEQPTSYIDIYSNGLTRGIEIAKGFAEWVEKFALPAKEGLWFLQGEDGPESLTTSQLLEKYIQSLDKPQP